MPEDNPEAVEASQRLSSEKSSIEERWIATTAVLVPALAGSTGAAAAAGAANIAMALVGSIALLIVGAMAVVVITIIRRRRA